MAIIKRDPIREIEKFFDEDFFGFVPAVKRNLEPPMDIYETDKDLVVEFQATRIDPNKVEVTIEDGVLKISAEQEDVKEDEGKNYLRREIRKGSFIRMISLPTAVKEEDVKAEYSNGMLKITLPKMEQKHSKKINVEIK